MGVLPVSVWVSCHSLCGCPTILCVSVLPVSVWVSCQSLCGFNDVDLMPCLKTATINVVILALPSSGTQPYATTELKVIYKYFKSHTDTSHSLRMYWHKFLEHIRQVAQTEGLCVFLYCHSKSHI